MLEPAGGQDGTGWTLIAGMAPLAAGAIAWCWRRGVLKPRGLEPGGLRTDKPAWQRWPWYTPFGLGVGVFFAAQLAAAMIFAPLPAEELQSPSLRTQALATAVGVVVGVGVGAAVLWRLTRGGGGGSEDGRVRWRHVPRGAWAFVLATPVVFLVGMLGAKLHAAILGEPPPEIAHNTLAAIIEHRRDPWAVVMMLGAVLGAPVLEEIIFRGLIQTGVQRLVGSAWGSVLITSALFALVHWSAVPPGAFAVAAASLFTLSVSMGVAYERTRMLGVPIVMHALFNAANVALALLAGSEPPPPAA